LNRKGRQKNAKYIASPIRQIGRLSKRAVAQGVSKLADHARAIGDRAGDGIRQRVEGRDEDRRGPDRRRWNPEDLVVVEDQVTEGEGPDAARHRADRVVV
jgi:hypothetical protein